MANYSTYLNVGKEEYVEFTESFGTKEFLRHIWDASITPFQEGDVDTHTIHLRARINPASLQIEFPVVRKTKNGMSWVPTGKWYPWNKLAEENSMAIKCPPSLDDFIATHGDSIEEYTPDSAVTKSKPPSKKQNRDTASKQTLPTTNPRTPAKTATSDVPHPSSAPMPSTSSPSSASSSPTKSNAPVPSLLSRLSDAPTPEPRPPSALAVAAPKGPAAYLKKQQKSASSAMEGNEADEGKKVNGAKLVNGHGSGVNGVRELPPHLQSQASSSSSSPSREKIPEEPLPMCAASSSTGTGSFSIKGRASTSNHNTDQTSLNPIPIPISSGEEGWFDRTPTPSSPARKPVGPDSPPKRPIPVPATTTRQQRRRSSGGGGAGAGAGREDGGGAMGQIEALLAKVRSRSANNTGVGSSAGAANGGRGKRRGSADKGKLKAEVDGEGVKKSGFGYEGDVGEGKADGARSPFRNIGTQTPLPAPSPPIPPPPSTTAAVAVTMDGQEDEVESSTSNYTTTTSNTTTSTSSSWTGFDPSTSSTTTSAINSTSKNSSTTSDRAGSDLPLRPPPQGQRPSRASPTPPHSASEDLTPTPTSTDMGTGTITEEETEEVADANPSHLSMKSRPQSRTALELDLGGGDRRLDLRIPVMPSPGPDREVGRTWGEEADVEVPYFTGVDGDGGGYKWERTPSFDGLSQSRPIVFVDGKRFSSRSTSMAATAADALSTSTKDNTVTNSASMFPSTSSSPFPSSPSWTSRPQPTMETTNLTKSEPKKLNWADMMEEDEDYDDDWLPVFDHDQAQPSSLLTASSSLPSVPTATAGTGGRPGPGRRKSSGGLSATSRQNSSSVAGPTGLDDISSVSSFRPQVKLPPKTKTVASASVKGRTRPKVLGLGGGMFARMTKDVLGGGRGIKKEKDAEKGTGGWDDWPGGEKGWSQTRDEEEAYSLRLP